MSTKISMSIHEIKLLCDRLQDERALLHKRQQMLHSCNLTGHQNEITVSISGIGSISLTSCSRDTGYAARVIRGREMILLGAKKSLSAAVDAQSAVVRDIEQTLSAAQAAK